MLWQPKNAHEFLLPVLSLWKFTFLPTIYLNKTKLNTEFYVKDSKLWFFGFLILGISTTFFVSQRIFINYTHFMISSQYATVGILNLSLIFISYQKRFQVVEILNKFISAESFILFLNKSDLPYNSNAKFIVLLTVVRLISGFSGAVADVWSEKTFKSYIAFYHLSLNYQLCFELILYKLCLLLGLFYSALKDILLKQSLDLADVTKAYLFLDNILQKINSTFQKIICIKIVVQSLITTVSFYYNIIYISHLDLAITAFVCWNNEMQILFSLIIFIQFVLSKREKLINCVDNYLRSLPSKDRTLYKQVLYYYRTCQTLDLKCFR